MGAGRELVLLLAGDAELAPAVLGGLAHGQVIEGIGQGVQGHRVEDLEGPVFVTGPGVRQQVRGPGHGLHPAGHDHVVLAEPDRLGGQRNGVQAGQADLVDRQRRDRHRYAGRDRRLPRGDLARAGLQHLAHDDVVDLIGPDPCAQAPRRSRRRQARWQTCWRGTRAGGLPGSSRHRQ